MQPYGRNRYGPKIGELCPFDGGGAGLGPRLKQCGQGWGLPACQVNLDPSNHLATIQQRHRQTGQDRQDNGLIA